MPLFIRLLPVLLLFACHDSLPKPADVAYTWHERNCTFYSDRYERLFTADKGYCAYRDDCMTTFYETRSHVQPVRVQECDQRPGLLRIVNPYGKDYYHYDPEHDDGQDHYIIIDATDPDHVYIPQPCAQGIDWGHGQLTVWSLAGYHLSQGDDEAAKPFYGTLRDGVVTFPAGALYCSLANYPAEPQRERGRYYAANLNALWMLKIGD